MPPTASVLARARGPALATMCGAAELPSVGEVSNHTHQEDVMTTTSLTRTTGTAPQPAVRRVLLAAPLVLGALTVAAVVLLQPWGERNDLTYATLAPHRDAVWTGVLLDGLAMAAIGISLALVVAHLARGRGSVWAGVGGVFTTAGGVFFAMGIYAFGSLAWYVTDPAVLDPAQGAALLEHAHAQPQHGMVLQMAGFLTFSLGVLLLCVALLRAGTVGRWLPVLVLVLTVAQFAAPVAILNGVQVAHLLALGAIGLASLRPVQRS